MVELSWGQLIVAAAALGGVSLAGGVLVAWVRRGCNPWQGRRVREWGEPWRPEA